MKFKKFLKWEYFERLLRVLEVSAIILAACIVFQIPKQMDEWRSSQGDRSINLLLKFEDRMGEYSNEKIFNYIDNKRPILIENKGIMTEEDLDFYLNNLASISWAYENNLISIDNLYTWFSEYFVKTVENNEIQMYLLKIRKDNPLYYMSIDSTYGDIEKYKSNN